MPTTFETRHKPRLLSDLVFADAATAQRFRGVSTVATARNVLLWGPGGSGKSAATRLLAETLVGPDYLHDITKINVSRYTSRTALCDRIEKVVGTYLLNDVGRRVFLLEELDGADAAAQNALKGVMDDLHDAALFLATTNNIDGVITPIRDRFLEIELRHAKGIAWTDRSVSILSAEGIKVSRGITAHLIQQLAPNGTARDILRALDDYAARVRAANMRSVTEKCEEAQR